MKKLYICSRMIDRQKIVNKIQQIVKGINPSAETILYGSQARGEATSLN